ncbi:hypothetical protein ACIQM0_27450 [Streptomyces sp. NPDC091387]|uniref:hypothetical protein n=1 Tax=Streptomyces sp. NPDC091387 TaxID=3365998 RepID=UPI00380B3586
MNPTPAAALDLIEQTLGRAVDGLRIAAWASPSRLDRRRPQSPALAIATPIRWRGATVAPDGSVQDAEPIKSASDVDISFHHRTRRGREAAAAA